MISRLDLTAVENTGSTVKLVFNDHLCNKVKMTAQEK